jgi:hypothetical protein
VQRVRSEKNGKTDSAPAYAQENRVRPLRRSSGVAALFPLSSFLFPLLWSRQSSEEGVKGDDRTWQLAVNAEKVLIAGDKEIHFADYR